MTTGVPFSTGASTGSDGLYTQTDTLKVIREVCADLAAAYYMEDEADFPNKRS